MLFFQDGEFIAGELAKECGHENPEETIFHIKLMLGRPYDHDVITKYRRTWPFEIKPVNNKIQIQIHDDHYNPEDCLKEVALHLKKKTEEFLGYEVRNAVVAVPAHFNELQTSLTTEAVTNAGWNIAGLINEPTAAAIAYNAIAKHNILKHCLIFDLGGGTFDVAVVESKLNHVKVVATDGDSCLGGEDFDNEMMDYCIREFRRINNINLRRLPESPRILRRIKFACENTKRLLSKLQNAKVSIEAIHDRLPLVVTIRRDMLVSCITKYLDTCMIIVDRVLKSAGKPKIDELILVGGSTRIPRMLDLLKKKFNGIEIKSFNPDEAVARGAAIFGKLIENNDNEHLIIQEMDKLIISP